MKINDFLNNYFKSNNITQKGIERTIGISQYKIRLILNGKRKLSAEELIKIAIAYNIDLNKLKEIK